MAAISIIESVTPQRLSFQLLRAGMRAARHNAGDRQPTSIRMHAAQRQRYALFFGREACPFTFDGVPIEQDNGLEPTVMQFDLDGRLLAEVRNLEHLVSL